VSSPQPTSQEVVDSSPSDVVASWAVHALTGTGVIVGFIGLDSVIAGHARAAIIWLIVALLLDGVDGPVARKLDVRSHVPMFNGNSLDLIIDFFTCAIVPVAFLDKFAIIPDNTDGPIGWAILFVSGLWMARVDHETHEGWFNGFPGEWNMIIPSLYLMHLNHWFNLGVCVVFIGLTLSRVQFPHPVSVREHRPVSIACMVAWVGSMLWLAIAQHNVQAVRIILCVAPLWTIYQVARRVRVRLAASEAFNDGGWPDVHRTAARAARAR